MKRILLVVALASLPVSLFSQTVSLKINITRIKAGVGNLEVAIFAKPAGFPSQYTNATYVREIASPAAEVEVVFDNLTAGRYAVSVLQDINKNGKLDTSLIGIPKEPWGVSNNVKAKLGPPSFESALISVREPLAIGIVIASGTH